jgi:hypothetical protein
MTFGLSICWRGPPGSGKRHALQQQLQLWAKSIGQLYVLKRQLWNAPTQGGEDGDDDDDDDDASAKDQIPMEMSVLHWGFDCARMSLQDKRFVKVILERFGRGSQVLSQGHVQRCLVFYHAHLLSSESVIYLQSFLEQNHKDTVLWLTSEYPLPPRLADWCVEIPIASAKDKSFERMLVAAEPTIARPTEPEDDIVEIYKAWMATPPKLSDVKKIRAVVYGLLHRNIRWTDGFHLWMFALDKLPLTPEQKRACAVICIQQPFTGSGQTVPSYRIPVLWENYLIRLRNALAPAPTPADIPEPIVKQKKTKKTSNASPTHS